MNATKNDTAENIYGYCHNCGESTWHIGHGMIYDDFTEKTKVGHLMICNECGISVPDYSWSEFCRKWKKLRAMKEKSNT